MPHDFRTSLAWSNAAGDEPFWIAVYKKAFPNFVNAMGCEGDTASQRMGIDRIVHLANGKILTIDEKKRKHEYGDILLEYISNDRTGAPGWIEKDLLIDYIAYAFMPSKRCYLLPWLMLRRAWQEHKSEWQRDYKPVQALNEGYMTWSIPVPINILLRTTAQAGIIDVDLSGERAA